MSTQQRVFVLCLCAVLLSVASADFNCTSAGYFADPADCHSFYHCHADLSYSKETCTSYGHFDPTEVCVMGGCTNAATYTCPSSGYFPDPEDCHSYYSCDNNLVASHATCTSYGYFSTASGNCELGPCPTTAAPVTTTPSLGTPTPSTGFVCTSPGYFADPKDCRKYYSCSSTLVATSRICMGGGGHFDAPSGGCASGKC